MKPKASSMALTIMELATRQLRGGRDTFDSGFPSLGCRQAKSGAVATALDDNTSRTLCKGYLDPKKLQDNYMQGSFKRLWSLFDALLGFVIKAFRAIIGRNFRVQAHP